jgi:cytochrome c biogenesis protein CcdA
MAFGMSTVELRTGMWFIAGRTVGLVLLGLLIIFAGMFLDISPKLMQGTAGLLALGFGSALILQHTVLTKRHKSNHGCDHELANDGGQCTGKRDGSGPRGRKGLHGMDLDAGKRPLFGFSLGLFRGITPCFKIIILAPLLVVTTVPTAIAMVLVFTFVSLVYPVIGYLSANTLHNFVRNRETMIIIGGIILILIGAYYMYESFLVSSVHVGGA